MWQPTPVFLSGEFHGQMSLAGYSLWGRRESDMTKRLTHTNGGSGLGTCVHPWQIHVDVWQNKYNIVK